MTVHAAHASSSPEPSRPARHRHGVRRFATSRRRAPLLAAIIVLAMATTTVNAARAATATYPVGVYSSLEPSGESPPIMSALPGYTLHYINDFIGTKLPAGWDTFTGIPGGDPGGQFASSHVTVSDGMLQLNTWRDPRFHHHWVTGGLCQCGLARVYGAYFVRSRVTGAGPNEVELLWPVTNRWPPEIDFSETLGKLTFTSATLHYGASNVMVHRTLNVDMTKWHTWGVIWSPTNVSYLIDGQVWGEVKQSAQIPRVPMTLDMEQRTRCTINRQCPNAPVTMQIDWVAEYVPS